MSDYETIRACYKVFLGREPFDTVIAIDISQGHLNICESRLNACGIKNVEYMLLKNPESINDVAPYDCFFFYDSASAQSTPRSKVPA